MSIVQAARLSRAPIAGLAAVGVFWGGFAALSPDIKAAAGASDQQYGFALLMASVGGMVAMYLGPRVVAALGHRVLPLAAALLVMAFAYPALAYDMPTLAVAMFGMGVSVATLDISSNVRISALESHHKVHLMNLNHAMFSFAFAGSAFLTSLARKEGWDAGQVMPALALIAVALLLVMIERTPWEAETEQAHKPGADLPWTPIVMAAAILFAAFVCENATEAWSALHIERTLGAAHGTGGFGPMMLGLTMGFGRLGGQLVAEKVGEARLIMISALVGVVGALVIAWAPNEAVALTGVGLLGFGVAVMVPSANSILGHMVPKSLRGYAISRAWLFGFTGFFLGPTLMGFVSEQVGLRWAFVMIAGFMAAIVPLVLEMRRRGG